MTIKAQVGVIGEAFAQGLRRILANKLYGSYIYGAAAFPEAAPTGDIDFHVVLTDPLTDDERSRLYELHDSLARDFPPLGGEMDGYYILLADARCASPPQSQMWRRATDKSWALHREHIRSPRRPPAIGRHRPGCGRDGARVVPDLRHTHDICGRNHRGPRVPVRLSHAAELFPVAFAGGGLLMWAALRARSRRGLIGWGLGIAVGLLLGGWALAAVTGVPSGETEPAGWFRALVVASIVIYSLALVEIGVAGVLLVRDLFQHGNKGGVTDPVAWWHVMGRRDGLRARPCLGPYALVALGTDQPLRCGGMRAEEVCGGVDFEVVAAVGAVIRSAPRVRAR